ncbi:2-dehydro-3-deoxy-6-phosphogalactonate aldolase [Sphingomonas ginsenosidivorax]|uniref:2-dehydro-3-deoxy-6-phosphogalactonate aldolase n=2 Tax=Sphingomonas ginsenosidivorax TaxID=862135 RepID=A0A5C6UJZ0_9SPHN|nr:2-dehydro-3-deoxy-6-phosphogalactonate aldolase [Sphingomonas ginsenosidivorax]
MEALPLVAILRGITPAEIDAIGDLLVEAGFRLIEVPLTSPDAFASIARLVKRVGPAIIVGAGTVRTIAQLRQLVDCGGRLMVTPHGDVALIRAAKALALHALPGVATPTEAFAALDAGADGLKMFPADTLAPSTVRAWRTVMGDALLCPTGGIEPATMEAHIAAGASGFGLGSALYAPGASLADTRQRADAFVNAWNGARRR